jgi:hypothetical protein
VRAIETKAPAGGRGSLLLQVCPGGDTERSLLPHRSGGNRSLQTKAPAWAGASNALLEVCPGEGHKRSLLPPRGGDNRPLKTKAPAWAGASYTFRWVPPWREGRQVAYPSAASATTGVKSWSLVSLIVAGFEWCLYRRRQRKHAFPFRRIPCTRRCKTPQTVSPSRRTQHTEQSFRRGSRSIHAYGFSQAEVTHYSSLPQQLRQPREVNRP